MANYRPIRFATLLVLTCTTVSRAAEPPPASRPPNVVFILADDLGWADLGCYGSTFHQTPNLDRLAAQGMRFTQAYAAAPICSPTRASILCGKSPARLHLTDWLPGRKDMPSQMLARPKILQHLPLEEVTMAEALKPAGYATASVGKWHLGGGEFLPDQQGFDRNVAGTAGGSPPSYTSPYGIRTLRDGPDGERLVERLTDEAVKFIQQNRDRPFFLYLPHYAVHIPLASRADLIEKYRGRIRVDSKQDNAVYAALLEELDTGVGRVMRTLDDLNLSDRTILVFMSDNGGLSVAEGMPKPPTSNDPLRAGKGYLYEGGIRVPLIVRWPGAVKPGTTCDTPVVSTDWYPTILEACGVASDRTTDGVSILPLLKRSGELPPRDLFWHYPHYANQGGKPGGAVRSGDWKLIEFYEDYRVELFDLKHDVGEHNDMAEKMPATAVELRAKLHKWRESVEAQMMTPNPAFDRAKAAGARPAKENGGRKR